MGNPPPPPSPREINPLYGRFPWDIIAFVSHAASALCIGRAWNDVQFSLLCCVFSIMSICFRCRHTVASLNSFLEGFNRVTELCIHAKGTCSAGNRWPHDLVHWCLYTVHEVSMVILKRVLSGVLMNWLIYWCYSTVTSASTTCVCHLLIAITKSYHASIGSWTLDPHCSGHCDTYILARFEGLVVNGRTKQLVSSMESGKQSDTKMASYGIKNVLTFPLRIELCHQTVKTIRASWNTHGL